MKLVSFGELCGMPDGTVFQEYEPHNLGNLCIFGGARNYDRTTPRDFLQASLLPSATFGSSFARDAPALPNGSSVNPNALYICTPEGFGGWGKYDKDAQFLVWEREDCLRLANWLINPKKAVDEMNNDPHAIIEVP